MSENRRQLENVNSQSGVSENTPEVTMTFSCEAAAKRQKRVMTACCLPLAESQFKLMHNHSQNIPVYLGKCVF